MAGRLLSPVLVKIVGAQAADRFEARIDAAIAKGLAALDAQDKRHRAELAAFRAEFDQRIAALHERESGRGF